MDDEVMAVWNAPKTLKTELPIPWVLEQEGFRLELQGQSLVTRCPFHADSDPSFTVYLTAEKGWRWGCWPCGLQGDVLDLLQALYGVGFTEAVTIGRRGAAKVLEDGWKAPALEASGVFDSAAARELLAKARTAPANAALSGVAEFLLAKGLPLDPCWLERRWDVQALNGELLVPVYSRARELVGVKHRRCDGSDHLFSFPGSALGDVLYGEDRLRPEGPILLCEGESDAWLASWLLKEAYSVLSVATGAGSPVRPAARLAGREVHVVFDGDEAGRLGGARWEDELRRQGCVVTRWALPEGHDLCSLGTVEFLLDSNVRSVG